MTGSSQTRAASRSISLPWIAWVAVSLFVNFDHGGGLYSSQLLLVLCGLCWTVLQLYRFDIAKSWIFLSLIAFTGWSFLIENSGGSGRFLPEFGKWAILGLSFAILTDLEVEASFDSITLALPILVSVLTLITRLFGNWDTYDPLLHRLSIPQLGGSPNTAAYVFAFCMLMVHYQWGRRRGFVIRLALASSFMVLVYGTLASESRGGLVAYVAGSLFLLKPRWRFAALVGLGAALAAGLVLSLTLTPELARFNMLMEARDTGGTGRAVIWVELIGNLVQHPLRMLWGNGPGAINFYLFGLYLIQSGHSVYVETLYAYGLIGLALLLTWVVVLFRNCTAHGYEPARRKINLAIWFAMVVSFALDADPMTAQIVWFTPLLGALLVSSVQPPAKLVGSSASHSIASGRDLNYPETSIP